MIFQTHDDGRYSAADAEHGIQFHIDRLRRERHELVGELCVTSGILSARAIDGALSVGTFNFSNPRSRDDWARRLAQRARTGNKLDWYGLLEEVCQRVLAAEREGHNPAVVLRDVPRRSQHDQEFSVLGLTFPREHATIPFGDGGSLKSLLSLRVASELAADGLRVGFFDWELDQHVHRDRLERINGPDMPDVIYVRCERPLVYEVDRLRRIVQKERLEFAFLDSIGFGTDGPPESAESAMAYCRAVRHLGIGTWLVAHVTKGDNGDQRPFGSVFWHNSARATWNIKLAATSPDGQTLSLGAFHRKSNLGRLQPPQGLTVQFQDDRIHFCRTDVTEIDELAESLPLWQRITGAVRHQPQTLAAIAEQLGAKVETIDRTVRRKKDLFTKVTGRDGVQRIALVERRVS